ncbi:MAG: hypothetical protein MUC96_19300 [Myxococcaceae bacterium]|nr:hypothetical protein [Myxococcaceae bacterium]
MGSIVFVSLLVMSAVPMPGEAEARRFSEAFERGEALYSKGDYGAAIALFREADRMKVTPEVAFDLARSFEKLGDVAFTVLYDRLYLSRAPDASDSREVSSRLQRVLARAEDEGVGFLEVFAPGATSLVVNGRAFAEPPAALFLAPGEYVIEGTFRAGPKKQRVNVSLGEVTTVWFEPVRPPLVKADEAPEAAIGVREGPAAPRGNGLRISAWVLLGLGVATLGAGVAMGALASGDASRAADKNLTVREATLAARESNEKATIANVLFGAGGVVAATGATLFVISIPGPSEKVGAK